jgi:hypothetical protein
MRASDQQHYLSQLFTIRLWEEALGDGHQEYRGKVQHVVSGEARHFRDWTTLEAFLLEKLKTPEKQSFRTNKREEGDDGNRANSDIHER